MATVTGFTAERMLAIENSTVVDGEIVGDNLILMTRDGTPIDAGVVKGDTGATGPIGPPSAPPGIIRMFAGLIAPTGHLFCDGSLQLRADYPELFSAIGTQWGAGDGSTTFGIPNLQQRFPVGKGTEAWADVVAEMGGSKDLIVVSHGHDMGHTHAVANHSHNANHGHTATAWTADVDNHTHPGEGYPNNMGLVSRQNAYIYGSSNYFNVVIAPGGSGAQLWSGTSGLGGYHRHSAGADVSPTNFDTKDSGAQTLTLVANTQPTGSSGADKNLPPYVVVNFIIKT
jgi:microcystin-dependent protein